jgi:hypothetical protein
MPIPASGFCLSTVCAEFIPGRLAGGGGNNLPSLDNMVYWGSQTCISIGTTGCRLSQFANKCRVGVSDAYVENQGLDFLNTRCFYIETCLNNPGNDFRPTNSTQARVCASYCITSRCGEFGTENFCENGTTTVCVTSTPTKVCSYVLVSNPYPGSGNSFSKIYVCGIGFNGFGTVCTGAAVTNEIQWLDIEDI